MTDDNITFINRNREVIPNTNKPDPLLIEFLEKQLKRAKDGEIVGIAGAFLTKEHWGEYFTAGTVGGFSMVGALHCACHGLERTARGEK